MTTIAYLAARKLEKTGYLKIGTDISAAASDDSFNATSTNLSGLLDNQWIKVSGFANAVNNGWFQVNGNSTTTKISQDTLTTLVTEAAGPSVTIVGYKRGLGQTYQLEFGAEVLDRSSDANSESNQPMADVAPEVVLYREEALEQVRTTAIDQTTMNQFREFLSSVRAGESFTFDKYGTIASPSNPLTAVLVGKTYSEQRENVSFKYRVSFTVRVFEPE